MAENTDPPLPWTHRTLQAWARTRFPLEFEALDSQTVLLFKDRKENNPYLGANLQELGWRTNASTKLLKVGTYIGSPEDEQHDVYAFVHGANKNMVAYVVGNKEEKAYEKLSIENHFWSIKFDEKFSRLGNRDNSAASSAHARLRALILYYYVAAGNLNQVEHYNSFPKEFWGACTWIKNEGERPQLADGPLRIKTEDGKASASSSRSEGKQPVMETKERNARKRAPDSESCVQQAPPKKQHLELSFHDLQRRTAAAYCQLEDRITVKDEAFENLRGRLDTLSQDYEAKNDECEKLKEQLKTALEAVETEKRQVEVAKLGKLEQMEKAQAAERRAAKAEAKAANVKAPK